MALSSNQGKISKRLWICSASIVCVVVIFALYLLRNHQDQRQIPNNATGIWTGLSDDERVLYLDDLLGQEWELYQSVAYLEKTKLWGMNKSDVIRFLGPPDTDGSDGDIIWYNLGFIKHKQGTKDRMLRLIAPDLSTWYHLQIEFDMYTGLVSRIIVSS